MNILPITIQFEKVILWLALVLLFPTLTFAKDDNPKQVPVGVAKVRALSTQSSFEYPGTVQAWATTQLAAEVEGRVDELLFTEGQYVAQGTPLVKLRIDPLIIQRDLARAEKKLVEARLEELTTGTRPETIEAAQSSVEQSKARVRLADNELKRIQKLYKEGVLSLDEFDKADAQAQAARAELEQRQSILNELVAGPRAEKIKQENANLKAAEARIQMIQDNINRSILYAPFNSFVVGKQTEVGQWLEQGDPAVSLIASSPLKVEIHVPQFQFNRIEIGATATVTLEDYDGKGSPETFNGKVVEKIPAGDPVSRTFPVRLKISKSKSLLAPGMLVKVHLKSGTGNGKELFVPKDAIVRTPKDTSVWVIRENKDKTQTAEKIDVQTGRLEKNLIAIQAGSGKSIQPGDWVVVQGNERLKPNDQVNIIKKFH